METCDAHDWQMMDVSFSPDVVTLPPGGETVTRVSVDLGRDGVRNDEFEFCIDVVSSAGEIVCKVWVEVLCRS